MVKLKVNGKPVELDVDPDTPLLWALRDELGLTGSKFGVVGFVKSLALRLAADKIRVNAVCPGPIDTPMLRVFVARPDQKSTAGMDPEELVRKRAHGSVPLGRTGRPEEIANAALFLLSDEASFVPGVALPVDGGVTAA